MCAFCWADANSQALSPLLRSGRTAGLRIALRIELEMHTAYFSAGVKPVKSMGVLTDDAVINAAVFSRGL